MSSITGISSNSFQSLLGATETAQSTKAKNSGTSDGTSALSLNAGSDGARLSPFAQLLSTLQKLQSDPTQYKSLMSQISTDLKKAADDTSANGNSDAAKVLNQLSTDFAAASQSGELPNIQDLAAAVDGDKPPALPPPPDAGSNQSTSTSSTSSDGGSTTDASSAQIQDFAAKLLKAFHDHSTQSDSTNPMAIIFNTLSSAGAIQQI